MTRGDLRKALQSVTTFDAAVRRERDRSVPADPSAHWQEWMRIFVGNYFWSYARIGSTQEAITPPQIGAADRICPVYRRCSARVSLQNWQDPIVGSACGCRLRNAGHIRP